MINQFKQALIAVACMVVAGGFATPAYALSCGDSVSGIVTLTHDLVCTNSHGLVVVADNTTINLNGFTISCTGSGFKGSCQRTYDHPTLVGHEGIKSNAHSAVAVNGPGTIKGFTVGVNLLNGAHLSVKGVSIDGPITPSFGNNTRGDATGIQVVSTPVCEFGFPILNTTPSFTISDNTIMNQALGISIFSAACGFVGNNTITRNARRGPSGPGGSWGWGIEIAHSQNITLMKNDVVLNGNGGGMGGGVHLISGTTNVFVTSNLVHLNCGEGIYADGGTQNKIQLNTATDNGVASGISQCTYTPPGAYFDLAQAGAPNVWNVNNVCNTQSQAVPYGVCNPTE